MKIRVVSDGTPHGMRVENAETGELVEGVVDVEWRCGVPDQAEVYLKILRAEVDLIGDLRNIEVEKL